MKKLLLILGICVLWICCGREVLFAEATLDTGNFTVSYTEPTLDTDGMLLSDLAFTTIYYSLNGGNKIKVMDIPASSLTGGGVIQQTFTIEGLSNQVGIIISYTASDLFSSVPGLTNNESGEFFEPVIGIDSISPNSPIGN